MKGSCSEAPERSPLSKGAINKFVRESKGGALINTPKLSTGEGSEARLDACNEVLFFG